MRMIIELVLYLLEPTSECGRSLEQLQAYLPDVLILGLLCHVRREAIRQGLRLHVSGFFPNICLGKRITQDGPIRALDLMLSPIQIANSSGTERNE